MRKPHKKLYQKYMISPLVHMIFTRIILCMTAALLWDAFINIESIRSMRTFAFLLLGFFLVFMGWLAYLRLDGIKMPVFDKRLFEWKKKPKRIRGDMIDFIDETVVSFDEFEEDEKNYCRLIADLFCGGVFILLSFL